MPEGTPMMLQYHRIKEQHEDCILFFRLGDFYEMFNSDARVASRELDLTLTTRDRNKELSEEERVPMCGVPYHSAEAYIARLVAKGYKVAICEQTEDPALAKGLVDRDVIRIITPGTVIDASMLEENRSNYICAICAGDGDTGICFADISTGEACATSVPAADFARLQNELVRFSPREAVLGGKAGENKELCRFLKEQLNSLTEMRQAGFAVSEATETVLRQFAVESPAALGLSGEHGVLCAAGGLF
ncbi:MAG: DNA mismatch repair protein MutS, partial [Oscillospiraceae bacterium]|nr:DNA mismatch repair protein MutS [Oscillospiraceae bacterium]